MEELAQVYANALFEVASEHDVTDDVREQLGQFAEGADERFLNFLELLAERHRMPVIFRIRRAYDALWRDENKLLPVTVTSAVDLDEQLVEGLGERIEEQTGKKVELTSRVDADVLGGLVLQVGNMVLDASIRNRLEQLRKQVAKAA
jgi:F-type H+-transporting ATPase subunit delta